MESKKDDGPEKARFLAVRGEIYKRYTAHRTLTDRLMKRPTVEEFINSWIETVFGKGLTFDFFNDPLVHKVILVTVQCTGTVLQYTKSGSGTIIPDQDPQH